MSGLLALLDDVAGIAKVAAASVDDIAGQAAKAGAKAAGAVIDDAAVSPKYVHGFEASRELPIVGKIALGSIRNKLVFLLPAALLLAAFAPWLISPLLMLGGGYLCFEGAEKVWHVLFPHEQMIDAAPVAPGDPMHLEREKVAGAIKTDFILSAEIMTIALAAMPPSNVWMQGATLALVAVGITAAVYGAVAILVKMDDLGLAMVKFGRLSLTRALGAGIVKVMPGVMKLLLIVGTAAMIWVGGSIVVHGLHDLGWHPIFEFVRHWAEVAAQGVPQVWAGAVGWTVTAALDGVFGLALGVALIPVATRLIGPAIAAVMGKAAQH
ncbi:MAG: ABC transporter [Rhodobacterales bacterium CG2_30_65_12]|nr:MAG: ABC transporter [Rhodobacterales bacterium CG2_30_65_12]